MIKKLITKTLVAALCFATLLIGSVNLFGLNIKPFNADPAPAGSYGPLMWSYSAGEIKITWFNQQSPTITEIEIPAEIDNGGMKPVTSITGGAFSMGADLISITIPASVQNISEFAFMNCTSATTIYVNVKQSEVPAGWEAGWSGDCQVQWMSEQVPQAVGAGTVSITGWTYGDGVSHSPTVVDTNEVGHIIEYRKKGDTGDWIVWGTATINAGEYDIRATFYESAEFLKYEAMGEFTVAKGQGSGTVSLQNWTFGALPKNPVTNSTTNGAVIKVEYKTATGGDWTEDRPTEVGNYVIRVTFEETLNYEEFITDGTATFSITEPQTNDPDNDWIWFVVGGFAIAIAGSGSAFILSKKKIKKA